MTTVIDNDNIFDLVKYYITDKSQLPSDLTDLPISKWNVSQVTDMQNLFEGDEAEYETFNESLNEWDVSNVEDMQYIFSGCTSFNQPLNNWDVSNVKYTAMMFAGCKLFNQSINGWNVSNVESMEGMFFNCTSFNQPLNNWDVSNVENMSNMFNGCTSFNQPLNNWNIGKVEYIYDMFNGCTSFNQPLNNWDINDIEMRDHMFLNCGISAQNRPPLRIEVNAFQIHSEFKKINCDKLNEFLKPRIITQFSRDNKRSRNIVQFPQDINLPAFIRDSMNEIIESSSASGDEKLTFIDKFKHIFSYRLRDFNYAKFKLSVHESIFYTLEYVKTQSSKFKHTYIDIFIDACVTAYESDFDDGMICGQGAVEQIIMALVFTCKSILTSGDNNAQNSDYEQIIDIIIANPETLIPEYIKDWYRAHKNGTEIQFGENVTVNEKKASLRAFLLEKFPKDGQLIEEKIALFADNIGYDADDFMFGGTRRRKHKKHDKTRKNMRKNRQTRRKIRKNGRKTKRRKW